MVHSHSNLSTLDRDALRQAAEICGVIEGHRHTEALLTSISHVPTPTAAAVAEADDLLLGVERTLQQEADPSRWIDEATFLAGESSAADLVDDIVRIRQAQALAVARAREVLADVARAHRSRV